MRVAIGIHLDDRPARLQVTLDAIRHHTGKSVDVIRIPASVRGGAAQLNWLMRNADTPAVVLLENGCVVGPGWLEHLTRALESSPRAGLAGPSTNRAWNQQCAFPMTTSSLQRVAATAKLAERRFGATYRILDPASGLSDFCYAVRRDVFDAVGPADEAYGSGPMWELDYNVRAARAGFDGVWVCAAYVWRPHATLRRARDEAALAETNRRRFREKFAPPRLAETPAETDLVSCIMPTYDRRAFVPDALRCFFAQDYPSLELIVVDDGSDPVRDLLPDDPRIRYIRPEVRMSVGAKRNLACEHARGSIIVHWDDDDWYPATRVSRQVAALRERRGDVCGSSTIHFLDRARGEAYLYSFRDRPWVAGTTLAYRRAFWEQHPFPDVQVAEDTSFVWQSGQVKLVDLKDPALCVASIHPNNVSPKRPAGRLWTSIATARVMRLMGIEVEPRPLPLVSCLLLTQDRRPFIPLALDCYRSQLYPNRELLVVDDGDDPIDDLVRDVPGVRYLRVPRMTLGAKRNVGCEAAQGELVAFWDDDDWYGPHRLSRQIAPLLGGRADFTALPMRAVLQLPERKFWTASEALHRKMFTCNVAGGTSVFARTTWQRAGRYRDHSVGEDGAYLREAANRGRRVMRVDGDDLFVYVRHGANTWRFETGRHGTRAAWQELSRPAGFSSELVDAYAAAAELHAARRSS